MAPVQKGDNMVRNEMGQGEEEQKHTSTIQTVLRGSPSSAAAMTAARPSLVTRGTLPPSGPRKMLVVLGLELPGSRVFSTPLIWLRSASSAQLLSWP